MEAANKHAQKEQQQQQKGEKCKFFYFNTF